MQKPIGVYVHIPFCVNKCPYCNFYSVKEADYIMDEYVEKLCSLLYLHSEYRVADTVYFGGGTPTAMGEKRLIKILDSVVAAFDIDAKQAEISLEANPATINLNELVALRQAGFNRISFGVQSMLAEGLHSLGRIHTVKDCENAVTDARKAGFTNLSLDLMLGIPHQDMQAQLKSIEKCIRLQPDHISAYLLKIEEGTKFFQDNMAQFCLDEDGQSNLYLKAVELLEDSGFQQYEISNFAKNNKVCKHNLKYWNCEEYFGFGPAAHSFLEGKRFGIKPDLYRFLKTDRLEDVTEFTEIGGSFEEYVMLRLRLKEGLVFAQAKERFGETCEEIVQRAKKYLPLGLVTISKKQLALTKEGFLLSNYIISDLI